MTSSSISLIGTNYYNNNNINSINLQIQNLTSEVSTGQKAQVFGQLGGQDSLDLSLHAEDNMINGYQDAINAVQVKTTSMDTSMTNIDSTLSKLISQMNTIAQTSNTAPNLAQLQSQAQEAMQTIQQQLNTNVAGNYIFGGALNDSAPITNTSDVTTNVSSLISTYTSGTPASSIISSLNSLTETQLGYNTGLATAGPAEVQADTNTTVNYTVKADESQYQQAMVGIAEIANLSYDSADSTQFWDLFNDAKSRLSTAVTTNNTRQGQLGVVRGQLDSLSTSHSSTQTAIETNLNTVEDANTSSAATQLQDLTTQLQATYEMISQISSLSILNYLPTPTA